MLLRITPHHLLLLLAAALMGSGFVAQKSGMDYLGPHGFNAGRFVLATLVLLPLWAYLSQRGQSGYAKSAYLLWGGMAAGSLMFCGYALQQVGLQYTTAGNAGFITSTYIVIVPLLALFWGQNTRLYTWLGILMAMTGLYQLSVAPNWQVNQGDSLMLVGAFFWAGHVLVVGWLSRHLTDVVGLSVMQFATAAVLGIAVATWTEAPNFADFTPALPELLYSAVVVNVIAFTLQIIGQRVVSVSVAALILSLEAVFAAWVGYLFLNERLGWGELLGCALMLMGILVSQWPESDLRWLKKIRAKKHPSFE